MTPEQIKLIKRAAQLSVGESLKLKADKHTVSIMPEIIKRTVTAVVFVNGQMNGSDLVRETSISARFYNPKYRYPRRSQLYKDAVKALGKQVADIHFEKKVLIAYSPFYSRPEDAVKRILSTCNEVEEVE